jgi:hypothetical protein
MRGLIFTTGSQDTEKMYQSFTYQYKRENIVVSASGTADALYKAKQKWLEHHSSDPTIVGIKK